MILINIAFVNIIYPLTYSGSYTYTWVSTEIVIRLLSTLYDQPITRGSEKSLTICYHLDTVRLNSAPTPYLDSVDNQTSVNILSLVLYYNI